MRNFVALLSFLSVLFCACNNAVLKVMGITSENLKVHTATTADRRLVFVGMKHIGPRAFYANVTRLVDSLQRDGFVFYLEGTGYRVTDSSRLLTARQKMRKLMGFQFSHTGYIDTTTGTLAGALPLDPKLGLVNQPPYHLLGVDTTKALRADVTLPDLIAAFEAKHGLILLDSCDSTAPFTGAYTCKRLPSSGAKLFREEFILDYRNQSLADAINASPHKKVAVIYGYGHWKGLLEALRTADAGWVLQP